MKLKQFIDKYKVNTTKFAAKCDTTVAALYFYMQEKRKPRQKVAEKIEKESDGLVTVMELRGKDDRIKEKQ